MTSEVHEDGERTFRRSLLLATLFDVLRKAEMPLPRGDALRRVHEAIDLTPHEDSHGPGGKHRTDTFVSFGSSWATTVGWMTKKGGWALTEAGAQALDNMPDKSVVYAVLHKLYRQTIKMRREAATTQKDPRWATVEEAMSLIPDGSWTAYKDLGELVGLPGLNVGQFIAKNDVPNAQRVLQVGGTVAPEFAWSDPANTGDPKQMLIDEGVEFDSSGRANQAQRLTVEDLRELIGDEGDTSSSKRAWLVRGASVNGLNLVPTWLAKGSCSVAASRLRPIEPPVSRQEIAAIVEDDYSHVSYNARNEKITEFDAFINRMQPDDIVVTTSGGDFYVGRIVGDCSYVKSPDDRSNLRRAVVWANADSPVDFADLPDGLTVKLSSQHAIVDLTNEIGSLESLVSKATQPGRTKVVVMQIEATLPDATDELARRLLVDREWLQEQIELLRDRRQLIFYGPPGTGKTYLAQAVAEYLTDREAIKLVQFHPAYSYEDFFEGFRPVSSADGSGVAFKLSPGPFRRLVDAARENPGTAYVLIIDEINRANLAKVFGELYFLLEYRGQAIDLLYSAGDEVGFTLPKNVYLIGTMNTADRSIALVDTAMRRRFAFTALHPSEEPTSGVLGKWLAVEGHPQTCARVLESLNGLIEDEDFKIGPSYFMRASAQSDTGLRRVWKSSILPLLEEHHYGESIDVAKRYDLGRILRSIAPDEPSVVGSDGDVSSDPEQEPDEVF
jgi:5-methylcytosine-specific restriction enzyme B